MYTVNVHVIYCIACVMIFLALHHQLFIILSSRKEGHSLTQAQTALATGDVL